MTLQDNKVKSSPAYRTMQRMKQQLEDRGFEHSDLDERSSWIPRIGTPDIILYGNIEGYFQEIEGQPTFVTLLLTKPGSSLRHLHPRNRYSIEVRYFGFDRVPPRSGKLYGHFGRNGEPLNEDAQKIQELLFN